MSLCDTVEFIDIRFDMYCGSVVVIVPFQSKIIMEWVIK